MFKICTACKAEKPLEGFYRHPTAPLGRACKCIPCSKSINAAAYDKNRAARLMYMQAYREKNKDFICEMKRADYKENKQRWETAEAKARARQWRQDNRERLNAMERRRFATDERYRHANRLKAAARRAAVVKWADEKEIGKIYQEAARKSVESGIAHVVDHVIPIKHRLVCGLHVETNLRVVTEHENAVKKNSFMVI